MYGALLNWKLFLSSVESTVPWFLSIEANSKYLEGRSAAMPVICCKASLYPSTSSIPLASASPMLLFPDPSAVMLPVRL